MKVAEQLPIGFTDLTHHGRSIFYQNGVLSSGLALSPLKRIEEPI
jgi:hypothetical protein